MKQKRDSWWWIDCTAGRSHNQGRREPTVAHLSENHFFGGRETLDFMSMKKEELEICTLKAFSDSENSKMPHTSITDSFMLTYDIDSVSVISLHICEMQTLTHCSLTCCKDQVRTHIWKCCELWHSVWQPKGSFQNLQCFVPVQHHAIPLSFSRQ